ncbi:MAG: hypothetical protein HYZ94_02035 [Candidatus Omnitrophica bacterium]|nr:hypothetical protein [Candidatus Omnitrophota bacterium]
MDPPQEGFLLPARSPRLFPFLKYVSVLTVFAFTLTSVIPAGWAWPSKDDQTLRVQEGAETKVKAGLEERLREGPPNNKEAAIQTVAVPAPEPAIEQGPGYILRTDPSRKRAVLISLGQVEVVGAWHSKESALEERGRERWEWSERFARELAVRIQRASSKEEFLRKDLDPILESLNPRQVDVLDSWALERSLGDLFGRLQRGLRDDDPAVRAAVFGYLTEQVFESFHPGLARELSARYEADERRPGKVVPLGWSDETLDRLEQLDNAGWQVVMLDLGAHDPYRSRELAATHAGRLMVIPLQLRPDAANRRRLSDPLQSFEWPADAEIAPIVGSILSQPELARQVNGALSERLAFELEEEEEEAQEARQPLRNSVWVQRLGWAAVAGAAVLGGLTLGVTAQAQAQAPGAPAGAQAPQPPAMAQAPVLPSAVVPTPPALLNPELGYLKDPNSLLLDAKTDNVRFSAPRYFEEPRGLKHPYRFWEGYVRETQSRWKQASEQVGERVGIGRVPVTERASKKIWEEPSKGGWAPGRLSARSGRYSYQPDRTYTLWAPGIVAPEWWPPIFQGMRKAAGAPPGDDETKGFHSRVYLDPGELLISQRTWSTEEALALQKEAMRNGVQVVPILGDPLFARYPDLALYMVRNLYQTGLMVRDGDGKIRIAFDIEPSELDDYFDKKTGQINEEKARSYWENILLVVGEVQKRLSRQFQQASQKDNKDVEVTLYVPPDFAKRVLGWKFVVPAHTRLVVMAHADTPEEIAAAARETKEAFQADARRPEGEPRSFDKVTYGVSVEIGPFRDRSQTLWRDPSGPYGAERVGVRTEAAGRLLEKELGGDLAYTGENVLQIQDVMLDLVPFLHQGGMDPEWMADREIREYLHQAGMASEEVLRFLSSIPYQPPPSRYGPLPDGRSIDQIANDWLQVLFQRIAAGGTGTGTMVAHWITMYETTVQSLRRGLLVPRFHKDTPLFDPTLGMPYGVLQFAAGVTYGEEGRIEEVARTLVDPSQPGFPIEDLKPGGEMVRGKVQPDGSVLVTGQVDDHRSPGEVIHVAPGRVVRGARIGDGSIVPGRLFVHDPDILADGRDPRRRDNDGRIAQAPSNRYDIYWVPLVRNEGKEPIHCFIRLYPHTGDGEPLEVDSDSMTIPPGETRTATLRLRVGYDDSGSLADPEARQNPDAMEERGRLQRKLVQEAFFVINPSGPKGKTSGEVADAVGVASYDPSALEDGLRDPRRREELDMGAYNAVQAVEMSELSLYTMDRPLALRLTLDKDQDPAALVASVDEHKDRHGATYLLVDAKTELLDLVEEYRRVRREVINFADGAAEAIASVNAIWARRPAAQRLRVLLQEAAARGYRVSFLVDANDAFEHGDANRLVGDITGARDFFRILWSLSLAEGVGLDASYFTTLYNRDELRLQQSQSQKDPDLEAWVGALYGNAETPLLFLGKTDADLEIEVEKGVVVRIPQAIDLSDVGAFPVGATDKIKQALDRGRAEAEGQGRRLGLVVLTPEQCEAFGPADPAEVARRLVGDPAAPGERFSKGGAVSPAWLAEQINEVRRYLPANRRIPLDILRLREAVPVAAGQFSIAAHRLRPDPSRTFIVTIRVLNEDLARLRRLQYEASDRDVDLAKALNLDVRHLEAGPHTVQVKVDGAVQNRVLRGVYESRLNDLPFLETVPPDWVASRKARFPNSPDSPDPEAETSPGGWSKPSLWPINTVDVADPADPSGRRVESWLAVGEQTLRFEPLPFIEVEVDAERPEERRVLLEEHWAVTLRKGDEARGTLHFGRNSTLDQLYVWIAEGPQADGPVKAERLDRLNRPAATLDLDGENLEIGIEPTLGRVQLRVQGVWLQFWGPLDKTMVSSWKTRVLVQQDHSLHLALEPNQPLPTAKTEPAGAPLPEQARVEDLPSRVLDVTAEQVTPYSTVTERLGRLTALATLGAAVFALGKGLVNAVVRWSEQAVALARSPHRSAHTAKPINPLGWKGGLVTCAKVGAVVLLALLVLAVFPPTAALLGLGAGWAAKAAAIPWVGPLLGFFAAKLAAVPWVATALAVVNAGLSGQAAWATVSSLAVKAGVGLLIIRFIVDGLGAFVPQVANWPNQAVRLLYRLFRLDRVGPELARPIQTTTAVVVSAAPAAAGLVLRSAADAGRWVGRFIIGGAVLFLPVNCAALGIPAVAAALQIPAAATTTVGEILWIAGEKILETSFLHPAAAWMKVSVWGMGALIAGLWLRHAWEVARNQRSSRETFSVSALLAGPVAKLVVAGATLAALYFSVPVLFAGGLAAVTVLDLFKIYLAYRVLAACSRVTAESGFELFAFLTTGVALLSMGWGFLSVLLSATFAGFLVWAIRTIVGKAGFWGLDERDNPIPTPDIGRVHRRADGERYFSPWVYVLCSQALWAVVTAGVFAYLPLRLLVGAAQSGAMSAWLIEKMGLYLGGSMAAFLTSPRFYTVISVLVGAYWSQQYLSAGWNRLWIPLYRKGRGAHAGHTTPPLQPPSGGPGLTPAGLEEQGVPSEEGAPQQGTRWDRARAAAAGMRQAIGGLPPWTREGVTQREMESVRTQAIEMANAVLLAGWPNVQQIAAYAATLPPDSDDRHLQEEFVATLVSGMALRLLEARRSAAFDIGADIMQGPTHWTLTDMFRRVEGDDRLKALNANISVDPAGNPEFFGPDHRYFYGGLGPVVLSFVWISQKIQYAIAMIFRTMRAAVTEPVGVNFRYGSGIHSDMENNPESFVSEVMGRWLEGHKEVIASMLSGNIVLNPNRNPSTDVRLFRGQADQVEFLESLGGDPISELYAAYISERDEWDYHLGIEKPGLSPRRLERQRVTEEDLRVFGTNRLDSGNWLLTQRLEEKLMFAPIQFVVRNGEIVPAEMGRWNVLYRTEGDHPGQIAFTKSSAFHGFLGLLHKQYDIAQHISGTPTAPQVTWKVESLDRRNDRRYGLQPAEEAEGAVRQIKEEASADGRKAQLSIADHMGADGVWYGPDQASSRLEDLGSPLGLEVFGGVYGTAVQLAYGALDILTGKYFATCDTLAQLGRQLANPDRWDRRQGENSLWRALRIGGDLVRDLVSLAYILGGPFGLAGLALLFGGHFGLWTVGCLLLSSWSIEWIWRRPHEVSYLHFRKHPVQAAIQGYYDPEEACSLTVDVTGTLFQRITRTLPPLPEDCRTEDAYEALVEEGETLLERPVAGGGTLRDLVLEYARTLSREQRAQNRNKRTDVWVPGWEFWWNPLRVFEGWQQTVGRRIRQEIRRAGWRSGSRELLAVQRAILQTIKAEHLAVGNPEAGYLHAGSASPQIQHRNDLNLTPVGKRSEDPNLRAAQDVMAAMLQEKPKNWWRRGWAFAARLVQPLRVTSRRFTGSAPSLRIAPTPTEEIAGSEETAGSKETAGLEETAAPQPRIGERRNAEHFGNTFLRPSTDAQVQVAAQGALHLMPWWVRALGSPDLRWGGMLNSGPAPAHLGGISALVTASIWWTLGKVGLLGAIGLTAPTVGTAVVVGAGAVVAGVALHELAHALDNADCILPLRWRGSLAGKVLRVGGRVLNRLAGSLVCLWVGWKLALGTHAAVIAMGAGGGVLAVAAPVVAVAAAMMVGVAALAAHKASLLTYRTDAFTRHGWPGEGLHAVGRIPGVLLQYPAMLVFKTVVLSLDKWAPFMLGVGGAAWAFFTFGWVAALIALPVGVVVGMFLSRRALKMPWSWDIYIASLLWLRMDPDTLGGLIDRMEHSVVMGSALFPGKLMGRPTIGWRRYTEMEAPPVPGLRLVQLSRTPNWVREPTGMSVSRTAVRAPGLGLAEDSYASWVWEVQGYEGEPVVAAFGMINLDKELKAYEESRDDAGSFHRSMQFINGAGTYLSYLRLMNEAGIDPVNMQGMGEVVGELAAMPLEQRIYAFAALLWALEQKEQADTGSSGGAGAYRFLFSSLTTSQLALKRIGMMAPGEGPAMLQFLYYMIRDQEMGGALARQIFQLNAEQPGNPLANAEFPAGGTLAQPEVLGLLLGEGSTIPFVPAGATGGWAVDPRGALAAAKVARAHGWFAMRGIGERVSIRDLFVRIIAGFFNKQRVLPIKSVARYRKVVMHLEKYGKGQYIRLRSDWDGQDPRKMIWSRQLGSSKSARTVLRWRRDWEAEAKARARNPEQFGVRFPGGGSPSLPASTQPAEGQQTGLEEAPRVGRRGFLATSAAMVGAIFLESELFSPDLFGADPAVPQAAPPAAAPASGDIREIRAAEQQILQAQRRQTPLIEELLRGELERVLAARRRNPAALPYSHVLQRRLQMGQGEVFERQRDVLDALSRFLEGDPEEQARIWEDEKRALFGQIEAEKKHVHESIAYMVQRRQEAMQSNLRVRGGYVQEEIQSYDAALKKARILLDQLDKQKTLCEKLAQLTTLPLPNEPGPGGAARNIRNLVVPIPNPTPRLDPAAEEALMDEVRKEIRDLLGLVKASLQVDIDLWPTQYERVKALFERGVVPEETLKKAEVLLSAAPLKQRQQEVLSVLQEQVMAIDPLDQVSCQLRVNELIHGKEGEEGGPFSLYSAIRALEAKQLELELRQLEAARKLHADRGEGQTGKTVATQVEDRWLTAKLTHNRSERWGILDRLSGHFKELGLPLAMPEGTNPSPAPHDPSSLAPTLAEVEAHLSYLQYSLFHPPLYLEPTERRGYVPVQNFGPPLSRGYGLFPVPAGTPGSSLLNLSGMVTPIVQGLEAPPKPEDARAHTRAVRQLFLQMFESRAMDLADVMRVRLLQFNRQKRLYQKGEIMLESFEKEVERMREACVQVAQMGTLMAEQAMSQAAPEDRARLVEALEKVRAALGKAGSAYGEKDSSQKDQELRRREAQAQSEGWVAQWNAARRSRDTTRADALEDRIESLIRERVRWRALQESPEVENRLSAVLGRLERELGDPRTLSPQEAVGRYEEWSKDQVELDLALVEDRREALKSYWIPHTRATGDRYPKSRLEQLEAEREFLGNRSAQLLAQRGWYAETEAAGMPVVKPENPTGVFSHQDDPLLRPMGKKIKAQFLGKVPFYEDGRWVERYLITAGWLYIGRPVCSPDQDRWIEDPEFIEDLETGRQVLKERMLSPFGDLAHHIDPQLPESLGTMQVNWQSFWPFYEAPGGWFWVEGPNALKPKPTPLGYLLSVGEGAESDKKLQGLAPVLLDENGLPNFGVVAYTVMGVNRDPRTGAQTIMPVGAALRVVPREEYRDLTQRGIPLKEGVGVDYGHVYLGDMATYGPGMERMGEQPLGMFLPLTLTRVGYQDQRTVHEVRIVFRERDRDTSKPGEWALEFYPFSEKDAEKRRSSGAGLEETTPDPLEDMSVEEVAGLALALREAASSSNLDASMDARRRLAGLEEATRSEAIRHVQSSGGVWQSTDTSKAIVLLFEHPETVGWAVLAAQAGARTAVVVQTFDEMLRLQNFMEAAGIPEGRCFIESLDMHGGDVESARAALREEFAKRSAAEVELVPAPQTTDTAEMIDFLNRCGFTFRAGADLTPALEAIDKYLGSLA